MSPFDPAGERSGEVFQRQIQTIAENATLALFIMDEQQHCVYVNPAAEQITGFQLEELRGRALHDIIHHTRPDVTPYPLSECPIDQAFPQNMREQGEEVFVHRDGHFYPVSFTASPMLDDGRPVGTIIEVRDVTAEKLAEAERLQLIRQIELERTRLHQILMHAPALISVTRGPEHVFDLVNPTYQTLLGNREILGKTVREALPELAGQGFFEMRDEVYLKGATNIQTEARVVADLDGDGEKEEYFLNFVTQPLRMLDGEIDGVMTFAVDVSDQVRSRRIVEEQATEMEAQTEELQNQARQTEEVQSKLELTNRQLEERADEAERAGRAARAAAARLQVLADAGATLGSSLDFRRTLQKLSELIVPRLADWCFVEMPRADGTLDPVIVFHSDHQLVEIAWEEMQRHPVDPSSPVGSPKVLRTGEPDMIRDIPDELLRAAARDDAHYELLKSMGFRSHLAVPLAARERTLGVLTLVMADSNRSFTDDDLPFAQELARRAALAIDNSQLFDAERQAREAAERAGDRARRLAALAAALNEAAMEEDVAAACIEHGSAALGADRGSLAIYREDSNEFEVVRSSYAADVAEKWRRFSFNAARPLSYAVTTREPLLIDNISAVQERFPDILETFAGSETAAYIAIPIFGSGRPLGGLSFSFATEQKFESEDRTFVAALGQQAAQALERARLLEAERGARAEAESANKAKTEFLSAMSHELRTPLNAIAGYVDILDMGVHGPLTDFQKKDLERIKHAQTVLLGLINDVLNFARIEAGRIEFRDDLVEVGPLLQDLAGMFLPQVRAKQLSYRCEPFEEDLRVRGDAERIQQILINLVSNATKFTDEGGEVVIGVEEQNAFIRIFIRDTGRGIASEKLDTIFEPFVQLDRPGTHQSQQGVGLGLAISLELARAMDGDLVATSSTGAGSEFSLLLPRAEAAVR
ncbi:hypothetical protein BH23GEM6_BH23GEM6_20970 [soil metagenome]